MLRLTYRHTGYQFACKYIGRNNESLWILHDRIAGQTDAMSYRRLVRLLVRP